ncbi:MAG: hypothetical protein ACP5NP_01715 [Acetobacteraceae bacterium]
MFARTTRLAALLALGLAVPVMARAEPHPAIREGLRAVNHAIAVLRRGANDFHGHKAAALRALGAARHQLILALRSD